MNTYITTGTIEYLTKLKENIYDEKLVLMNNPNGSLLLHETTGSSVFKEPRRYEVIKALAEFPNEGFAALYNIPVTEEGRPLFEHLVIKLIEQMGNEPGLMALRLLRPLSSQTFIFLTAWSERKNFQSWRNTEAFLQLSDPKAYIYHNQPKIFTSSPYVSEYFLVE
ncbi:antibiotic biosynthesis monooxygenase family protein [Bacillus rubiinfantis]|uniref:antibiotic biosynthesis monooxygenase family protein n=1 Tax=Bacillus rubiinfantis TaxID=1499680 RepID=UPI00069431DB|nr:antibiotic biosynthesis monooxygenase [Bacillus rubiinfantis]